jgi:SNF2 family DNA or RNA helicase
MTAHQFELERVIAREMREKGPLGVLDKLRKLYQHPALLDARLHADVDTALRESPKTLATLDILDDIRSRGEKALVFTQWVEMQNLLAAIFRRHLGLKRVNILNGDPKRRSRAQEIIRDFSSSPGFDVLILSPLAAGVGLTITAANHVIHYGRWWNPAKEDQATDRAYRIGQTKEVHVHYPLLHHPGSPGEGFDVKLHRLVESKRQVARDFLAPDDDKGLEREMVAVVARSEES